MTLTIRSPVVPGTRLAPFVWDLAVHVPEGFTAQDVRSVGVPLIGLVTDQDGAVLHVQFEPEEAGELSIVLSF